MTSSKKFIPPLLAAALMSTASTAQEVPRDRAATTPAPAYATRLASEDTQERALAVSDSVMSGLQAQPASFRSFARLQDLATAQRRDPQPDAPVVVPVDWNAAQIDARRQRAQASEFSTATAVNFANQVVRPDNEQAAAVRDTRLPVLLPSPQSLQINGDAEVLLFPHENFYNASITGDRLLVEIFGTRLAHARAPDARAARNFAAGSSGGYRIAPTEYGQEVHFNRYGAAYSITIECDRPDLDARCTDAAYARNLADALVIAAGSPEQGG